MDKVLSDMKLSVNKKENNFITNIYKKVKKPPRADQAHIQVEDPGMIYQADLLYLPNDDGYKYLLVVVDINNNAMDAEPLKKRAAVDIKNAFTTIFKRKYIKVPKFSLQTDDGSEFKNVVQHFLTRKGSSFVVVFQVAINNKRL